MKGLSIAGRKRNDGIDFYQTPRSAVLSLLAEQEFDGEIMEPCSGAGAISRVLEEKGFKVLSFDIRADEKVYGRKGIDFLKVEGLSVENIITNPPYVIAQEIIEKSLQVATKKVAMLLKLCFLESERRRRFFETSPLKYVYVFCKRVQMYPEGQERPKNSGTIAYAWYVWEKGYRGEPTIRWIPALSEKWGGK